MPLESNPESSTKLWTAPEWITLPESGAKVAVCRPTEDYFCELHSSWPRELTEKCDFQAQSGERANWTQEEIKFLRQEQRRILEQAFVRAREALRPEPSSPDFLWLSDSDTRFVWDFITSAENFPTGLWDEPSGNTGQPNLQLIN
jgi:hypothetical protein